MAESYQDCFFCGTPLDFSQATVVVGVGEPSYQPFGEDWRGGLVRMAHPKCFIEAEGVDPFLKAVAREDQRRRK